MRIVRYFVAFALLVAPAAPAFAQTSDATRVRVSPRDSRYFELSDGAPYIPIGLNLASLGPMDEEAGLRLAEEYLRKLGVNGGNHARVWLSSPFWDVEHARCGQFDEARAKRIDALLAMARRHGVRLKLTLEHFREIDPTSGYSKSWALKTLHHVSEGGTAHSMDDWLTGAASRRQFEKKLDWYAERYGRDTFVFGWELWNEVNAVRSRKYVDWTAHMLGELQSRFPENLAMQSLGSFDRPESRATYRSVIRLEENDVAQVHRYLDLGARLEVCRGPVDVLAADAVRELIAMEPGRPILLAESGAVEPNHTGPFALYPKDTAGIILHDVLFAPFFAGAAGCGQSWHWGHYVDRNDLWWHFARFAAVVEGIDPPAERFQPSMLNHPRLRVYVLRGRRTTLVWCRDSQNTWRSELAEETAPEVIRDARLDISAIAPEGAQRVRFYDPWADAWTESPLGNKDVSLPAFRRSLVLRIEP